MIETAAVDYASLREAAAKAAAGQYVAYAIALDVPWLTRLRTLLTLRWQLGRAEAMMERAGARVVGTYGIEPSLTAPTCMYELGTAASAYADRCLRPRGSAVWLRRGLTRCFGCDPALGGIVIIGCKS